LAPASMTSRSVWALMPPTPPGPGGRSAQCNAESRNLGELVSHKLCPPKPGSRHHQHRSTPSSRYAHRLGGGDGPQGPPPYYPALVHRMMAS
jgi:hypothetical protein